jgi:hypothetical protein
MRSRVAEAVRREQLEEFRRMSPTERVALARRTAARDLRAYAAVQKLDEAAALEAIRRSRRIGRKYSRCMDDSCP